MSIYLGGVELYDDLILEGLLTDDMEAYNVVQTLGGKAYVQSDANDPEVGLELSLVGDNWFDYSQLLAVRELRGQVVELVHPDHGTFNVKVIRLDVAPTFGVSNPQPDSWYSGEIIMITV